MIRPSNSSGLNTYGEYIARRAVQYATGGRAQQEREAVAAMAANHNKVGANLGRQVVNFGFGTAEDQMLVFGCDIQGFRKLREMTFGRLLDLVLDGGQIHRDVSAIGKTQGFDDMQAANLG